MREIKFRYVYKHRKTGDLKTVEATLEEIEESTDPAGPFSDVFDWVSHGYELIDNPQYTGLKDRNGVEIYEGDILKGYNGGYLYVIQYFQPDCRYMAVHQEDYSTGKWDDKDEAHGLVWVECEVIGNIYESKEE